PLFGDRRPRALLALSLQAGCTLLEPDGLPGPPVEDEGDEGKPAAEDEKAGDVDVPVPQLRVEVPLARSDKGSCGKAGGYTRDRLVELVLGPDDPEGKKEREERQRRAVLHIVRPG